MEDLKRQLDRKAAQLSALREIGRAINVTWQLQATLELITRPGQIYQRIEAQSLAVLTLRG
jgi:hypothetical protein